eukprot:g7438.t1
MSCRGAPTSWRQLGWRRGQFYALLAGRADATLFAQKNVPTSNKLTGTSLQVVRVVSDEDNLEGSDCMVPKPEEDAKDHYREMKGKEQNRKANLKSYGYLVNLHVQRAGEKFLRNPNVPAPSQDWSENYAAAIKSGSLKSFGVEVLRSTLEKEYIADGLTARDRTEHGQTMTGVFAGRVKSVTAYHMAMETVAPTLRGGTLNLFLRRMEEEVTGGLHHILVLEYYNLDDGSSTKEEVWAFGNGGGLHREDRQLDHADLSASERGKHTLLRLEDVMITYGEFHSLLLAASMVAFGEGDHYTLDPSKPFLNCQSLVSFVLNPLASRDLIANVVRGEVAQEGTWSHTIWGSAGFKEALGAQNVHMYRMQEEVKSGEDGQGNLLLVEEDILHTRTLDGVRGRLTDLAHLAFGFKPGVETVAADGLSSRKASEHKVDAARFGSLSPDDIWNILRYMSERHDVAHLLQGLSEDALDAVLEKVLAMDEDVEQPSNAKPVNLVVYETEQEESAWEVFKRSTNFSKSKVADAAQFKTEVLDVVDTESLKKVLLRFGQKRAQQAQAFNMNKLIEKIRVPTFAKMLATVELPEYDDQNFGSAINAFFEKKISGNAQALGQFLELVPVFALSPIIRDYIIRDYIVAGNSEHEERAELLEHSKRNKRAGVLADLLLSKSNSMSQKRLDFTLRAIVPLPASQSTQGRLQFLKDVFDSTTPDGYPVLQQTVTALRRLSFLGGEGKQGSEGRKGVWDILHKDCVSTELFSRLLREQTDGAQLVETLYGTLFAATSVQVDRTPLPRAGSLEYVKNAFEEMSDDQRKEVLRKLAQAAGRDVDNPEEQGFLASVKAHVQGFHRQVQHSGIYQNSWFGEGVQQVEEKAEVVLKTLQERGGMLVPGGTVSDQFPGKAGGMANAEDFLAPSSSVSTGMGSRTGRTIL